MAENGFVYASTVQTNGKIIVAGIFYNINGTSNSLNVARLNADGSVDNTFNPGTSTDSYIYCVASQSDGKIIIGGQFSVYQGLSRSHLARINVDGSPDTSFDPGSGASDAVNSISLQPDGKVVIGGYFTSYNGTSRSGIARVNADGSLDASFDPGSGVDDAVYATCLLPNGSILVGGGFTVYNNVSRRGIAVVDTNGAVDPAFDPGSVSVNNPVTAVAAQNDGKLVIGGSFTQFDGVGRNRIARLNSDGTLDTSFDPGTGFDGNLTCLGLQPNGKILAGGFFHSVNSVPRFGIARLLPNGGLDASFSAATTVGYDIQTLALQPDAKVFLGGYYTNNSGNYQVEVARLLLADGQPMPLATTIQAAHGNAMLSWNSATNGIYRVHYKSSLAATNWTALTPDTVGNGGVTSLTNAMGTNSQAYYQIALLPF